MNANAKYDESYITKLESEVLRETDWEHVEHRIGRELRIKQPNACHHLLYPSAEGPMVRLNAKGECENFCRHCGDLW
jgi:hypothetical protein